MPKKFPTKHPEFNALVTLLNIGSVYMVLALVGVWLDRKLHSMPICTAIAIGLGLIYFIYEAWCLYKQQKGS